MPIRRSNFYTQNRLSGLFLLQGFMVGFLGLLSVILFGRASGLSSLLGGLTCWLATYGMSRYFFRQSNAHSAPKRIVQTLYVGEIGKWLLSIGVFWVLFRYSLVQIKFFLVSYLIVQNVFWFAPFFMKEVNSQHD